MAHEEAPLTFSVEQGSALAPWLDWAFRALSASMDEPLPEPVTVKPPKGVKDKTRRSARQAFLAYLHAAPELSIERHQEIIKGVAPGLGWPWEGADGASYPDPKISWLSSSITNFDQMQSAWPEWAAASMSLLRDAQIARHFLPVKTAVEPWVGDEWGQWTYTVLDNWWRTHHLSKSKSKSTARVNAAMFDRWSRVVLYIDDRIHANPSPYGLPSHWQIAARQVEKCLRSPLKTPLQDIGSLPPIHSEVVTQGNRVRGWMGVAEWVLVRFTSMLQETHRWPADEWGFACAKIENDINARGVGTVPLLLPFEGGLRNAINHITRTTVNALGREVEELDIEQIKASQTEVEAWLISLATPQITTPSRASRRL